MHLVAFDGTAPPLPATPRGGPLSRSPPPSVVGLVIGQTPRDDLAAPLRRAAAAGAARSGGAAAIALAVRGALDGVCEGALPLTPPPPQPPLGLPPSPVDASDCPLITRLGDGTLGTVRGGVEISRDEAQIGRG